MKRDESLRQNGSGVDRSWLAGIAVMLLLLLIYVATLMPGVPPTDSGELILAAWSGGVAHAPGFPLYTALGWLWCHLLPVGRIAWRLNLFSAVCGALAGGLTYALALNTLRETERKAVTADTILAAAIGALVLGLGRTVWSWATIAEVYTLTLAFAVAILLLVVWWTGVPEHRQLPNRGVKRKLRNATDQKQKSKRSSEQTLESAGRFAQAQPERPSTFNLQLSTRNSPWPLILAAFLFGLGLGGHLTSIALLAPAIAFWLTARRGWRFWISKTALLSALALIAGALIYLYLPVRAAAGPLLNWGQPDTWQRFWWQVTAKQYQVSLLSAPIWPQVLFAARLWWTQFGPLGLALLFVGAWRMLRSQRVLFVMLALVILFSTLYAWAYVIEDDGDAYYLPSFLAGAVWVAWGAQGLLDRIARTRPQWRRPAAVTLCVLVPAVALAMNWSACNRRDDTIPEDYVRDTFAEIGPRGLLLTRDWQLYSPALYLQQIEGLRPDLAVIDTELLRRGWYFGLLHKLYPDLMASVAAEEKAFTTLRDAWERGDIPDGDPRIAQLQNTYVALIDALMARTAPAGRPVHVGPNRGAEPLRNATLNGQPDMEPGIGASWQWLPVGLSFRAVAPGAQVPSPSPLAWQIAPFKRVQPTAPERKIQAARADMATLHGLVQANAGNLTGAETDWRTALAIEPGHAAATELLTRLNTGR